MPLPVYLTCGCSLSLLCVCVCVLLPDIPSLTEQVGKTSIILSLVGEEFPEEVRNGLSHLLCWMSH